jgi:hypothetical protein
MALIIKTDRSIEEVLAKSKINCLEWLQGQVGGYLESLFFTAPLEYRGKTYQGMMLNEQGKLDNLPVNEVATAIAIKGGLSGDFIVGNVVLFSDGEID